jgi:site-specific DNA recombinase
MSNNRRVLGRLRLSISTDESTSIERQREVIEQWASANGHTVIGYATDTDVSGSVSPFDAPELGAWLDRRAGEWDVLACWKLDRLSRNTVNLNRLIGWCLDHDKTIVSTTEGIDISTPIGRLIASVISFLAEGELDAIRERTRASRSKLRELARWPGGKTPYGYVAVQNDSGIGWHLEHDPVTSVIVRRIVDDLLEGESLSGLARALTAEGVPAPRGGQRWNVTPLRKMLRSKSLRGYVHHAGDTVRDAEGRPIQLGPELVSPDEWDAIQARLDGHLEARKDARRAEASALSGLVRCLVCDGPMQHDTNKVRRSGDKVYEYRYFRCRNCEGAKIRADELEILAEETFLAELGDHEVRERVWVPGDSREADLREATTAYEELSKAAGTAVSTTAKEILRRQLAALDARLAELAAVPAREARWEWRATGETYAQRWAAADPEGRRDMLSRSGITFAVRVIGGRGSKAREFSIYVPDEVREKLGH